MAFKTFDLVKNNLALDQTHYLSFRSSEKSQIIRSSENETFVLVKKETFDLVKFDLPTPSHYKARCSSSPLDYLPF